MTTLTKQARETIKNTWVTFEPPVRFQAATIAGYTRHYFPNGKWGGDRCGCPDDRCIGYHHDNEDDCGCLGVCLAEYVDALRAS